MRDVQKLRELLERVSAASGPDRELDHAIGVVDPKAWNVFPNYASSLDASIALVGRMLPGSIWLKKDQRVATVAIASPERKGWATHYDGTGATFPLAILSALLRALISQAEGEGANG